MRGVRPKVWVRNGKDDDEAAHCCEGLGGGTGPARDRCASGYLAVAAGPHRRAIHTGRLDRHQRAPDCRGADAALQAAGADRQQGGRPHHHRHRGGRQGAGRRLHAAHRAGDLLDQRRLRRQAALRHQQGLRADRAHGRHADAVLLQHGRALQDGEGAAGLREDREGADPLRLGRHRQLGASVGRDDPAQERHSDGARRLQGQLRRHARRDGR